MNFGTANWGSCLIGVQVYLLLRTTSVSIKAVTVLLSLENNFSMFLSILLILLYRSTHEGFEELEKAWNHSPTVHVPSGNS